MSPSHTISKSQKARIDGHMMRNTRRRTDSEFNSAAHVDTLPPSASSSSTSLPDKETMPADPGMSAKMTMPVDPGMSAKMTMPADPGMSAKMTMPADPGMSAKMTMPVDPGMSAKMTMPADPGMSAKMTMPSETLAKETMPVDSGMSAKMTMPADPGMSAKMTMPVEKLAKEPVETGKSKTRKHAKKTRKHAKETVRTSRDIQLRRRMSRIFHKVQKMDEEMRFRALNFMDIVLTQKSENVVIDDASIFRRLRRNYGTIDMGDDISISQYGDFLRVQIEKEEGIKPSELAQEVNFDHRMKLNGQAGRQRAVDVSDDEDEMYDPLSESPMERVPIAELPVFAREIDRDDPSLSGVAIYPALVVARPPRVKYDPVTQGLGPRLDKGNGSAGEQEDNDYFIDVESSESELSERDTDAEGSDSRLRASPYDRTDRPKKMTYLESLLERSAANARAVEANDVHATTYDRQGLNGESQHPSPGV